MNNGVEDIENKTGNEKKTSMALFTHCAFLFLRQRIVVRIKIGRGTRCGRFLSHRRTAFRISAVSNGKLSDAANS